jgi:hypothetical protein
VIVGVVILVGFGWPGVFLPHGTVCQVGAEVGNYTIWMPLQLINIPDGGNVSYGSDEWNVTVTSGSLTMNALVPQKGPIFSSLAGGSGLYRAGIWAMYGDFNWTIYDTRNTSTMGVSDPCTQPYVAHLIVPGGACGGSAVIGLTNNSTDLVEPHVWNGTAGENGTENYPGCPVQTPGTYAWFDSSLHLGLSGEPAGVNWNLCGLSGFHNLVLNGIAKVPVALHVPVLGKDISISATLEWYDSPALKVYAGPTVSYLLPGGWNWTLAPVGPVNSKINPDLPLPGLVAFDRSAC